MVDLTRREAITYLNIPEKHFDNYVKSSNEIAHYKKSNRYCFTKNELDRWKDLRDSRTVYLSMEEYQKCFILAIQMAYTKKPSAGTGIRGVRSEMQVADDWILGIMAEFALKKFLKEKYQIEIELDTEPHPKEGITAQDVVTVNGKMPNLKVAMKASKEKNCWIVLDPLEYNDSRRSSDVYFFARVVLPSDHLFRILREHSFFDVARKKLSTRVTKQEQEISKIAQSIGQKELEKENLGKQYKELSAGSEKNKIKEKIKATKDEIEKLEKEIKRSTVFRNILPFDERIPVWLCGYTRHADFRMGRSIPGQQFDGDRFLKSVAEMKNLDADWKVFVNELQ
ncbi:MAG: hypothetical protein AAEJ53_13645 [Myxococcota bacterium]